MRFGLCALYRFGVALLFASTSWWCVAEFAIFRTGRKKPDSLLALFSSMNRLRLAGMGSGTGGFPTRAGTDMECAAVERWGFSQTKEGS